MTVLRSHTTRLSLTALAVVSLGVGVPVLHASAEPSPTTACVDAGNVWVHVEFKDTVDGGCATEFATGVVALESAGFDVIASEDGFVNTLDGEPSDRGPEDWWSYAYAGEDSTEWTFYQVGATASAPVAGSIEAWRLMTTYSQDVSSLPLVDPAELLAEVDASPSPTATPSVLPSESPSPTPSTLPSDSPSPTPSASASTPAPALPKTGN